MAYKYLNIYQIKYIDKSKDTNEVRLVEAKSPDDAWDKIKGDNKHLIDIKKIDGKR